MNKHNGKLLLFAASPFLIGYGMNGLMLNWGLYGFSMTLMSVLFSIYWIYGGYRSFEYSKSRLKSNLLGNGFALICIGLILIQGGFLGRLMMNFVGFAPQMFFLPMIRIVALTQHILFFLPGNSTFGILSLAFIAMILLYNIGYSMRMKKG